MSDWQVVFSVDKNMKIMLNESNEAKPEGVDWIDGMGKPRILVLTDDSIAVDLFVHALTRMGCEATGHNYGVSEDLQEILLAGVDGVFMEESGTYGDGRILSNFPVYDLIIQMEVDVPIVVVSAGSTWDMLTELHGRKGFSEESFIFRDGVSEVNESTVRAAFHAAGLEIPPTE